MSAARSAQPVQAEPVPTFSSILGQTPVVAMLRQALARRTLPHALLFVGPEGVGKRTTALALAAETMCTAGLGEACGSCIGCVQVAAGTHPDLRLEGFGVDERGERRERVLIEQVRAVQAFLGGRALSGHGKIAIFEEAQALTEDAQNALLKTLEEPPRGSLIVLVSYNASRLLPTVRSRCHRAAFAPLRAETMLAILRERLGVGAEDATFLLGTPRAASPWPLIQLRFAMLTSVRPGSSRRPGRAAMATWLVPFASRSRRAAAAPLELRVLLGIVRHADARQRRDRRAEDLTPRGKTESLVAALRAAEATYAAVVDFGRNANRALTAERMALRIGGQPSSSR